jgi:hypothetical protein
MVCCFWDPIQGNALNKNAALGLLVFVYGALVGSALSILVAWYPVRVLYCALSESYDCGEIFLLLWPLYCLIMPTVGGVTANLIYQKLRR